MQVGNAFRLKLSVRAHEIRSEVVRHHIGEEDAQPVEELLHLLHSSVEERKILLECVRAVVRYGRYPQMLPSHPRYPRTDQRDLEARRTRRSA